MAHADFTKKATMLPWIHQFLLLLHLELQSGSRTSHTKVPFVWSPDSEAAFYKLKELFTSAGLLVSVFSLTSWTSPITQVQYISSQMLSHASSQKNASQLDPEQILPASCTVGALTRNLEETIQRALSDDPDWHWTAHPTAMFLPQPVPLLSTGGTLLLCLPPWGK